MPITVHSSTAQPDTDGIVSQAIQVAKHIRFHGEVKEKIRLVETLEHLLAD